MTQTTRQIAADCFRTQRIFASLENHGIIINSVIKRDYYNMTFRNGLLHDGKVRTSYRWECSCNNYQVKDLLRAAGWRWDSKGKVWYTKNYNMETGAQILRALS